MEQFSCLVIGGCGSASIGSFMSARGAHSKIAGSRVAFAFLPNKLVLELARL